MTGACDACLRRGYLVGRLAARIAAMLDRPGKRVGALLSLPEEELVEAVADRSAGDPAALLRGFEAARARAEMADRQVRALCRHDGRYPPQLLQLQDAPAVLFVSGAGDLGLLAHDSSVAVVGTRRPSPYGREVAQDLGRGLGAAGVPVVSGLALGIDAEVHRGCLAADGLAVAVLACGPDVAYPRTNRRLYERVREHGLVVSELPPGQRPYRWSFPARNRIMAGLARITVVVEAADPSGSLITTQFATQLGRAVGAVPGQVTSRVAAGTNNLLKDGAAVVTGPEDLLDELFGSQSDEGRAARTRAAAGAIDDPVQLRLLEAVEASLGIDGICAHAGVPVREARAGLSRLERSGHVRRDPLGGYRRTAVPC
ncbi:MAG: DNA-processing protein DprA [Actinomycetota bacterium]